MERSVACYRRWIAGQEAGLAELEAASANAASGRATDAELRAVVARCMLGYQDYVAGRRALSPGDGTAFVAPPWCSAFERSMLWLGGCRPSLTIRLLYNLSGEGLEVQVEEFINGRGPLPRGRMGITPGQLVLINDLHRRTLHQEHALSGRLATLHEDVADSPLFPIVRQRAAATAAQLAAATGCDGAVGRIGVAGPGGVDAEVDAAMSSYRAGLAQLVAEADELRMETTRAMATEILTPRQAVEMLAAAKQLHLSVRDWSRRTEGAGAQQGLTGPRAVTANIAAAARRTP
ncbi:transcription factor HBP-1b(c38)-like [Panicum miliaceum]|uniref:Transcription factor HBP-1b(C38)-like n=1 Tax=Panicum miliaceum TaxID=4540 RepID=A0A3L6SNW0_PANMI|nr:transcription factor HBP-1b(c38)-like [Panicum miliaceum]